MSEFINRLKKSGNISFLGMRETAIQLLPNDKVALDKLHEDLKRGIGILDDEVHLNMYLRSFGKMHKAKLDSAFDKLPPNENIFANSIEIYDWGCGQGTATICLLDYLRSHQIHASIKTIHLIEPSSAAVTRAKEVIECFDSHLTITTTTKVFDKLAKSDFVPSATQKLHLFSNILDVDAFDLARFIHLFQECFDGQNYFVCVGPYYGNNRRVDEFIAATAPDNMFAVMDREAGTWQQQWTISMRIFFKEFSCIEPVQNIRKRIEESHKKEQFFAGYILDAVATDIKESEYNKEAEALYRSLSVFDVKSNKLLDGCIVNKKSEIAVLCNIISRGLPTIAPIKIEKAFAEVYGISIIPHEDDTLGFASLHTIKPKDLFEALHLVDPRFDVEFYNGDMLESSFEKAFIGRYLRHTESEYLCQILEPQRPLSSILSIPNNRFGKDQRVDFALEIPYAESHTGFIVEVDGNPYHSNIFQRLRDEQRDKYSSQEGWDTYRIEHLRDYSFVNGWEQDISTSKYLSNIKRNFSKKIDGEWKRVLEIVLTPFAVARIQRMILEAIMSDTLDLEADKWNICIVERDVPCAFLAIDDLEDKLKKIYMLSGTEFHLPRIDLSVISTDEFKNSPLHNGNIPVNEAKGSFDLCIDISMLLRDNIDALPLTANAKTIYIVRSSHFTKKHRTVCTANGIEYPPLVSKDSSGTYVTIKEREDVLIYFLQEIFRKPSFRTGQLPIISHALCNKTTIGLLPTGGGKSLTYQLSCILQPGVSIIVDPLVSLMVDQVRGMHDIKIDSCDCVNSGMTGIEKAQKLNLLQKGAVQLMLLSPERFMMENFRDSLLTMTEKNHIHFSFGVIDEVHCVSEWGHDFRTSYLHLGRNMINFMHTKSGNPLPIIGLTATASFDVLADVERELTLGGNLTIDSEATIRPENDSRPELTYRIIEVNSCFDKLRESSDPRILGTRSERDLQNVVADAKKERLKQLLREVASDINEINNQDKDTYKPHIADFSVDNFYAPDSNSKYPNAGIVFCPHAHGAFGVLNSRFGNHSGVKESLSSERHLHAGSFVGGDAPTDAMKAFNDNAQNLMVATKAFGMGIDKPNIRFTINFNHPSSIESYVQEAGRGGRDKKHAISYILYDPTEYIHLTVDKINDIRWYMGNNAPQWLDNYKNKFILLADFPHICESNGYLKGETDALIQLLRNHDFIENVDKNIDLWFHNNSFRGLYKEKVILLEMTDNILNAKPTRLLEVQNKLREETGNDDISLKVDTNKNSLTICSADNPKSQYGYMYLDTLRVTYNFINFDYNICSDISKKLINILNAYPNHSAQDLLQPINGAGNTFGGIYQAMAQANNDEYVFVTVSWENSINQDPEAFERSIKTEITGIATQTGWKNIDEQRYGNLKLNVSDFSSLLAEISMRSDDARWLQAHGNVNIYQKLHRLFCQKRDKDDTDKAIYRMCCIGLIEDVTIDYLSETYQLKIRKQSDDKYRQHMLDFFRKYYSLEQAEAKVKDIDGQLGRNYLDKCLGYLTAFVYENLRKKRYRAIEDMRIACEDSIAERRKTRNDNWLKEFIHLYFNSKYARLGYQVNGTNYSLTEDTDRLGCDDFDIVRKYVSIITVDHSGSEVENVKHLYGATLLSLRAHPDNAALLLLLTYCIIFLGVGQNETLKSDALKGYIEGFMSLYHKENESIWEYVDEFYVNIKAKVHDDDDFIKNEIIDKGKQKIAFLIHADKFKSISDKYII